MISDLERTQRVVALLITNREATEDWGEISQFRNSRCPKRVANQFLLCCLLDWQITSDVAWRNGERLVREILGNPEDVWSAIITFSEGAWRSRFSEYRLHRFPAGHNRLWKIAKNLSARYGGDASEIWWGKQASLILEELWALGAGEQISRMIVGALLDSGQISGSCDVKADVYVRRVVGRLFTGETVSPEGALALTRNMNPANPWDLDWPLWNVGKNFCSRSRPRCPHCYLREVCKYSQMSLRGNVEHETTSHQGHP